MGITGRVGGIQSGPGLSRGRAGEILGVKTRRDIGAESWLQEKGDIGFRGMGYWTERAGGYWLSGENRWLSNWWGDGSGSCGQLEEGEWRVPGQWAG